MGYRMLLFVTGSSGPNVNKCGGAPCFLRTSVLLIPTIEAIIGQEFMLDKVGVTLYNELNGAWIF